MLKIVKENEKYRLSYYEFLPVVNFGCTTIPTLARKVGLKTKEFIAIHLKYHAQLNNGKLWFNNEQDVKNCYMDIAFDTLGELEYPEMSSLGSYEIDKGVYGIQRTFDYINVTTDITKMARLTKIKKSEFLELLITNNAKRIKEDVYIFTDLQECLNCIEKINDFALGKAMVRKLIK